MDRILEHEVHKIWRRLHEFVQLLQVLQLSPFLFVEDVKVVLRCIQLHVFDLRGQICLLLSDFLVALLQLLFLVLQRANFFIYLLLHHLIQVLLLDLKLLHDAPK